MIVKIFYSMFALIFTLFGILSIFFADQIKKIMQQIMDKDLFVLIGILEISSSLTILFFRYQTSLPLIITLLGILMFVDGIFYLIGNKILVETFEIILNMDNKHIGYYSVIFFIGAILLIASLL